MDAVPHIAIVDDHRDIRDLVGKYLHRHGYRTSLAENASAFRRLMERNAFDLVVLDVMMPGEDGLSLCRYLRESTSLPVIMLTAMAEETDRIVELELGADDYLSKPFNPRELLARTKAVLRRVTPTFPGNVENWRQEAKSKLAEPLPTLANLAGTEQGGPETVVERAAAPALAPQPVSVTVAAPAPASGAPYSTWLDLPAHAWPLSRAAKFMYWGDATGMGLAVQLKDGSWLNSAFSKKMANSMLTARSLISLGVTAFILSLCAAFIARTMTKPMRRLAAAAEALRRGESVAPLQEKGPDDLRHTAVAFNLMQSRLQRFVEDRTRLLAAIGHDLRTPITSLRLRAEFVSDDETREKMLDTLDELRAMTEATLAFSREQATEEVTRNVDLTALVGSLCDDLIELGYEVTCVEAPKISYRCRPDALKRAVRNLVENAVRYGERARVSLRTTPQAIEIEIEDDGPGIPADIAEKVFEPFFRMERSRNRETGGIGLGLSISRNMVRHHGGDITLANTGQGLRATISLPHAAIAGPEAKGPVRASRRPGLVLGAHTPAE